MILKRIFSKKLHLSNVGRPRWGQFKLQGYNFSDRDRGIPKNASK